MGRIEVITRTERRRKYSPAERAAIMREAEAPDVTVREVAKRHDIAESLIYSWRTARRQAEKIAREPLTFISYGGVPQGAIAAGPAAQPPVRPDPVPTVPVMEELTRPHPGARPGEIGIDLPSGVRLSVDSYVNEKALALVCGPQKPVVRRFKSRRRSGRCHLLGHRDCQAQWPRTAGLHRRCHCQDCC